MSVPDLVSQGEKTQNTQKSTDDVERQRHDKSGGILNAGTTSRRLAELLLLLDLFGIFQERQATRPRLSA